MKNRELIDARILFLWLSVIISGVLTESGAPSRVAVDRAGNVYVADTRNFTIRKVTAGAVTTLAGLAGNGGSPDRMGSAASFLFHLGVAIDSAGNVYVADSGNRTIRKEYPALMIL